MSGMPALILLVEDELTLRRLIAEELADAGYSLIEADDGEQALERLRDNVPSLIVSDILMPRLDGAGLYAATRSDPRIAEVPFLFMSALSSLDAAARLPKALVEAMLIKPIDFDELLKRVAFHLGVAA
jgi:DNA-binding response OmpR family regulator